MEKRGLKQALELQGCQGLEVEFSDEMRLGLRGQVRKVLAPRGIKVVQRVQLEYKYEYLLLAVNPILGQVRWSWISCMKQTALLPVLEAWKSEVLIWDGAGSHRGKLLNALTTKRLILPSYSPELNPAERVFQEIRRFVEGVVYRSLAEKKAVVELWLAGFAGDVERVKRLCGWAWIRESLCST